MTAVATGGSAGGGHDAAAAMRARDLDRVREDPYAAMLQARLALHNNEKWGGGGPARAGWGTGQGSVWSAER